ncbi:hypothetical protein NC661_13630 [Aquibacillus koreensis]|uniref:Uncharacterized protein n=1 Tax=Aquibacillus koreensis TaxID=279446 RepID=A0A9X3WKF7_9BACI|nr:hypothetical protein [Aquibacillus koreensis]MCT2536235.1 hypothetical protein [Aquibacillus koreensis]MDC3421412.1 hypothetical protein [Aquibacillus koreensis]
MILSVIVLVLTGCKPKSIDTAIEKYVPYDVNKVIKKIEITDNLVLVFYTLKAEVEQGNKMQKLDDVLNIAIFKGNSEDGWEFLGENGWSNYNHSEMEVYDDTIFYKDEQEVKNVAVMYGRVYNPDIIRVEVGNEETNYTKANLFEIDGIRYFYRIYNKSDLLWKHSGELKKEKLYQLEPKGSQQEAFQEME